MQRPSHTMALRHPGYLLYALLSSWWDAYWRRRPALPSQFAVSVRPSAGRLDPGGTSLVMAIASLAAFVARLRREYRPASISNGNPDRRRSRRIHEEAKKAVDRRQAYLPIALALPVISSRAITAQGVNWFGRGRCEPATTTISLPADGGSNGGMLWHGRHGGGRSKVGAPIASHSSNAPLRANAANGVTGYDKSSLLRSGPCRP